MIPLTMALAYEIAEHLCAPHRSDVLRDYTSVWAWARSVIEKPGAAWAFVGERPMWAGGVHSDGDTGILWLAGVEGWTRYVKHAIKVARAIVSSEVYRHYVCEVHEADIASRRFAEHLGFRTIETREHLVLYGLTP